MLLDLRSKLWGVRTGPPAITGTGATTQSQQTNKGLCTWYSALTHKIVYLGTTINKLLTMDEPLVMPPIIGEGATEQPKQRSDGRALVGISGTAATVQRQRSRARARNAWPISGSGSTEQEIGWCTAKAEHIDVELEALAAVLAAF